MSGVGWRGVLGGPPFPLGVLCAGGMCRTLLLPLTLQMWQLGFLGLFVSFVRTLPQLHMHSFIFSSL